MSGMVRNAMVALAMMLAGTAAAQTPQPFPKPGTPAPQTPAPAQAPAPSQPTPARPASAPAAQAPAAPPAAQVPQPGGTTAATAGTETPFPLYPGAQFIASYDAGRGQRYLLYGATAAFTDLVNWYRTELKERGNLVFEAPPTHMFEIGRFRDDTMAFPPGVTLKDWTWGGSQGYPNPQRGGQPARFPSIIMMVAPPPAAPAAR